jgi:DNA-directed RNA polymerase specialized sigma24 family protein
MNYFDLSDVELMSRLKQDDRIAFEAIYCRYASDLHKYLSGKVDTKDDCEEILIDVFISLWLDRYSVDRELNDYLSASVKHRLVLYAGDNPQSQLFTHLKHSFYETREEARTSEEES